MVFPLFFFFASFIIYWSILLPLNLIALAIYYENQKRNDLYQCQWKLRFRTKFIYLCFFIWAYWKFYFCIFSIKIQNPSKNRRKNKVNRINMIFLLSEWNRDTVGGKKSHKIHANVLYIAYWYRYIDTERLWHIIWNLFVRRCTLSLQLTIY